MIVYHGSNTEIDNIQLEKCNRYKDFGQGFYVTTLEEQAERMARRTVKRFGGIPTVTSFEFNEEGLLENMNKSKEQDFLIQNIISQVVSYIAEDKKISSEEALKVFFSTEISKKIEDLETGYYLESPSYVYEILKKEM